MQKMMTDDTICAISTGPGGALAILRISGPDAVSAAEKVWFSPGRSLQDTNRMMRLGHALSAAGEPCIAVFMRGPNSYTGEDVVELQCHGGNYAAERLLQALLKNGVRMADPGEFTRRAFLNGKMDLTQAEAVLDLIQARTADAINLAERQLSGALGGRIREVAAVLPDVLAEIESRLDFPEEDLNWRTPEELISLLAPVQDKIEKLLSGSRAGAIIRNGVRLVIAGVPNVGKSSLLNRILGYDRAIVTEIPGTTRDTVEENAVIRGIHFRIADTAGVREDAADKVEAYGIERSKDSLRSSEVVIWMLDLTGDHEKQLKQMENLLAAAECHAKVIPCWNKVDLAPECGRYSCEISAETGAGLEDLYDALEKAVRGDFAEREAESAIAQRHEALLTHVRQQLELAIPELLQEAWELAAVHIRESIFALGTITGENASPDVLDEIFSRFCIGK